MTANAAKTPSSDKGRNLRGQTRQRLMDVGLRLFAQKGVEGVTVRELEKGVGLKSGSGSFYRHFNGKDALLEAIIEREIDLAKARRGEEQVGVLDPQLDIREALRLQFHKTLEVQREKADLIGLVGQAAAHFPAQVERLRKSFLEEATGSLAQAYRGRVERGEMVNIEPGVLAILVSCTMLGLFYGENAFGKPPKAYEDTLIDALVELLAR